MNLDFKRTNETWSQFRRRVSRLASTANKRLQRIEKNDVRNTPAYQAVTYNKGTMPRFGVKGKSNNEVIAEFWRLNKFLEAKTSTIKGIRQTLKEAEKNTGGKFTGTLSERVIQAGDYFAVVDMITDYLDSIDRSAMALDYNRIFHAVSKSIAMDKNVLHEIRNDGLKLRGLFADTLKQLRHDIRDDVADSLAKELSRRQGFTINLKL